MKGAGKFENGWRFPKVTGIYGTQYLDRAMVAFFGLGANRPQDAIYPTSEVDARVDPTRAPTSTSCISTRARCRRRRGFGHRQCTTPASPSSQIRSTAT